MKVNLGCGEHHIEGWVNADIDSWRNPDVILERGEPFPWETDTCDQIMMCYVLNHVPLAEMDGFLSEVQRVLSPKGRLLIVDENYSDGYPEHKKDANDGWAHKHITPWHCYAEALEALLRPFFSYTEIIWKAADNAEGIDFATWDHLIPDEGRFHYTDSAGFAWPIKGLGQWSCLITAGSNESPLNGQID